MDVRAGIKEPETSAISPMGLAVPPMGHFFDLSPINRRRWENFKFNRRGYWSLWIFLTMFVVSLFAEFICNDKPIFIHVNGRFFFPAIFTYPDTAFAKEQDPSLFGTAADYRDDYLMGLIEREHGTVIWPPVRFFYNTQVSKPPSPFPSKPTWLLNKKDCEFAASHGFAKCDEVETNWLGTDDGGRDVVARLIYGFRISVLFGLSLTIISSIIGVAAGAVQGYFGGWTDLLFQRFIEIWTSIPSLYLLLIISSVLVPGFFVLLGILLLFSCPCLAHTAGLWQKPVNISRRWKHSDAPTRLTIRIGAFSTHKAPCSIRWVVTPRRSVTMALHSKSCPTSLQCFPILGCPICWRRI